MTSKLPVTNDLFKDIKIKIKFKPSFVVIDDDQPIESNINYKPEHENLFKNFPKENSKKGDLGKRVVFFIKVENISCNDPDFRVEKFKLKFNFNAQFRMTSSPFCIKNFALGCFADFFDNSKILELQKQKEAANSPGLVSAEG